MKIGSIVRLINPLSNNESYRNAVGVVLKVYLSTIAGTPLCDIRFVDMEIPLKHHILTVCQHRVKILKE